MDNQWFTFQGIESVDTPALVIYKNRVVENISRLIASIDDVERLRPHIKTHKSPEVSRMMIDAGIRKFKCATIAEAEMLAEVSAPDILLAYQPVGPKASRLATLIEQFPQSKFSCIIDDFSVAQNLSGVFEKASLVIPVYIDLNVGMNRTGIVPHEAMGLYKNCLPLKGINIIGLHAYDGHLRDPNLAIRKKQCDESFSAVEKLRSDIQQYHQKTMTIVAGGTPTFSIHRDRQAIECSPGTYIYWDKGYEQILQEQHYLHAALVVTRIISKPSPGVICTDLGHKAIASENPIANRVSFLNAPDLKPTGHSEEHMIFTSEHDDRYRVGDVLYGVPYHVCPTVALHDEATVVADRRVVNRWINISRKRKITI